MTSRIVAFALAFLAVGTVAHAGVLDETEFAELNLGESIGINFVGGRSGAGGGGTGGGDGTSLDAGDMAGVVSQANWNNALMSNGGPLALVDASGAATGATVTWGGVPNSWTQSTSVADSTSSGDAKLMNGYVDTNTTSTTSVDIADIPYENYIAIVYYDGDGSGRSGDYTVNGNTLVEAVDNGNSVGGGGFTSYTQAVNSGDAGNYIVFGPETASPASISAMANNFRGPLNALQIVQVIPIPEPTSLMLGGVMAAGFLVRRRHRWS